MTADLPRFITIRIRPFAHNVKRWSDALRDAEAWFQTGMLTAEATSANAFVYRFTDPVSDTEIICTFSRSRHESEQNWRREELRKALGLFYQAYWENLGCLMDSDLTPACEARKCDECRPTLETGPCFCECHKIHLVTQPQYLTERTPSAGELQHD